MQRHASSQLRRELGALLAREDGRIHDQDVGALVGQAALAFEVPLAVAPFPPRLLEDDDDVLADPDLRPATSAAATAGDPDATRSRRGTPGRLSDTFAGCGRLGRGAGVA